VQCIPERIPVEEENGSQEERAKPTRKELLEMLDHLLERVDELPPHVMYTPISHYEFYSALTLLSSIFRAPA
jgi:hypothetical protein